VPMLVRRQRGGWQMLLQERKATLSSIRKLNH